MPVIAVEWSAGVEDAWADVVAFVPKLLGFLAILLIGWFVAKAIAKILDQVLERVGFDKAVERGGIKKAMDRSKYDASDLVSKLVFYAIFLLVLQMAFGVFGTNPVSDLLAGIIAYLPKVFAAVLIIVVASAVATAVREILDASLGGLSWGKLVANGGAAAIITVGVFAALDQLRIAPAIVTGLFYALLAIVVGSSVIAIGGGGVGPMRQRWERALARLDEEVPQARQQAEGAGDRVKERASQRAQQAKAAAGDGQDGTGARAAR